MEDVGQNLYSKLACALKKERNSLRINSKASDIIQRLLSACRINLDNTQVTSIKKYSDDNISNGMLFTIESFSSISVKEGDTKSGEGKEQISIVVPVNDYGRSVYLVFGSHNGISIDYALTFSNSERLLGYSFALDIAEDGEKYSFRMRKKAKDNSSVEFRAFKGETRTSSESREYSCDDPNGSKYSLSHIFSKIADFANNPEEQVNLVMGNAMSAAEAKNGIAGARRRRMG